MKSLRVPLAGLLIALLAGACVPPVKVKLPEPLGPDKLARDARTQTLVSGASRSAPALIRSGTPSPPGGGPTSSGLGVYEGIPPVKGEPINANIEGMPVPAFINEFFGTVLAVTFQMDPAVAKPNFIGLRSRCCALTASVLPMKGAGSALPWPPRVVTLSRR